MTKFTMIGKELKRLRRDALRLRQEQFADMLGVHVSTVSDWERATEKPVPRCVALLTCILVEDAPLRERVISEDFPLVAAREIATQVAS